LEPGTEFLQPSWSELVGFGGCALGDNVTHLILGPDQFTHVGTIDVMFIILIRNDSRSYRCDLLSALQLNDREV
jgi:hypothetical protein